MKMYKYSIIKGLICIMTGGISLVYSGEPVIYFTYNFNFNLNFAEFPVDKTDIMVTQGHIPLLDIFDKHKRVKADFFFSGYTSEYLQEHFPTFVERVKKSYERGKYNIGTYTYTHPVLSLIPYDNVIQQLRRGLESDQKVWDIRPKGLFLPEVSWDVCLPQIMKEVGIEWVSIYKEIVPEYQDKLLYPPTAYIEGINNTKAKVVLCTNSLDQGSVEELKERLDALYQKLKQENIDEFLVAFKDDAEVIYLHSFDVLNERAGSKLTWGEHLPEDIAYSWGDSLPSLPAIQWMDEKLTMLESLPYAKFMTMGEYIETHPPQKMIYAENISGHADFDTWLRGEGRERLNILMEQANDEIAMATHLVDFAEKMGVNVSKSRIILEEARHQLMLSENSDGRGFMPHSSRKIFVATAAVKAKELAQKALDVLPEMGVK